MKKYLIATLFIFSFIFSGSSNRENYWNSVSPFLKIAKVNHSYSRTLVHDPLIYIQKWDTLKQLVFWRSVMNLGNDSAYLNIYQKRNILDKVSTAFWDSLSEDEQIDYKDSLIAKLELDTGTRILYTTGKREFYNFEYSLNSIEMGIKVFEEQCVEPWYAQAILLIESPGKHNEKSPVGALGSFQLMKGVARKFGLTVNRNQDDRKDFNLSAVAASRLINEICLPQTRSILDTLGLKYNENDLWFRLMVLHVYHAGAYNVRKVMEHMKPTKGGKELIVRLWQTEYGRFRNASQNYSQVALASILELDNIIKKRGFPVYKLES